MTLWYALSMRIFRVRSDEDLDRTPECLNSESDVDVSVGVRSLLQGKTEPTEPVVREIDVRSLLRGITPLGLSVTEAARVRSHLRGETETLPENLVLIVCTIGRWEEDFVERGNEFWRWLKRKVCSL